MYLDSNQLTALPAQIGALNNLQELSLNSNHLTALPAQIGTLNNLRELYLDSNHLTALPAQIGTLNNLQWLYLNSNHLTALPAQIGTLNNLQRLYLDSNHLTALPAEIVKLNLFFLSLEQNPNLLSPISSPSIAYLYQSILLKRNPSDLKSIFADLSSADDKNLIYHSVWECAEQPLGDPQWGEHHVFDNMDRFKLAVKQALLRKISQ